VELVATTDLVGAVPKQTALDLGGTSKNVLPTTSLVLRFDRFLDPTLAPLRQSLCLQGSTKEVKTPDDCVEGRAFVQPSYDPVHQTLTLRLDEVLPQQTTFTLTLLAPPPDEDARQYGIRAFDGAPLAATQAIRFTTLDSSPAGDKPEAASTADRFCKAVDCAAGTDTSPSVVACRAACAPANDAKCLSDCCPTGVQVALQNCAYSPCHAPGADADGGIRGPAMGLDLTTTDFLKLTAIGKTSHQTQTGEHADNPDESGRRFGRAMPLIDPGNAGNSYLLYKLLAHPIYRDGASSPGPDEHFRMRKSIIVGMPMPAPPVPPGFADKTLETLSAWINQGAPTPACF